MPYSASWWTKIVFWSLAVAGTAWLVWRRYCRWIKEEELEAARVEREGGEGCTVCGRPHGIY